TILAPPFIHWPPVRRFSPHCHCKSMDCDGYIRRAHWRIRSTTALQSRWSTSSPKLPPCSARMAQHGASSWGHLPNGGLHFPPKFSALSTSFPRIHFWWLASHSAPFAPPTPSPPRNSAA